MFRNTFADISLDALANNWNEVKKIAGDDRFICPMVKANAYGHGDIQTASALSKLGVDTLGVCLIEEGLLLRAAGVKTDILVFRGFDKRGAEKILEYQMIPVVSTWEQLNYLDAVADDTVKIHLKFDTGMNRIGFNADQAEKLSDFFRTSKKLKLKAVLTHFAQGEDAFLTNGVSAKQADLFIKILNFFKPHDVFTHLLNSGGIASLARIKKNNVQDHFLLKEKWGFRPGLALYGYQPAAHFNELKLKPAMTLKSVVNNIRHVQPGESVSYGCTWTAKTAAKVAVVPIGYADGVHRMISTSISGKPAQALFAGQLVPIVGRICMDFLMLDVTHVVKDDDLTKWNEEEVVFFGFDEKQNFLSAENMAEKSNTIVWETLTSVGERVPRHYRGLTKS